MPLGGVIEPRKSEYGWRGIIAPRPLYGLARVVLAVAFSHAPGEERTNLGDDPVNSRPLPVSLGKPLLHHGGSHLLAWRAIQSALPKDAIISSDIGNNCAIGNAYPTFEEGRKYLAPGLFGPCGYGLPSIMGAKIGRRDVPVVGFAGDGAFGISMNEMSAIGREEWPAITMVIFRNYQWGAEKRNTTLWFDDNFVGTELDQQVSYAGVAKACGVDGVAVSTMDELRDSLAKAVDAQMNDGVTTFIEVLLNQELGEPFRRDAMKQPVSVAGISQADMRPQQSA